MLLHLPGNHGADAVQDAMVQAMSQLPETLRLTLTWDQGVEMSNHVAIAEATDLDIYFCDPHSPWQRGSNENTNGLLRQYFPKGADLSLFAPDYLEHVARKLNRRPRKRLDFRTPAEALDTLWSEPFNPRCCIHRLNPPTLFWRLLTDEKGNLLDVSMMGRYAAGNLGQAIRFRDGTSVFPSSVVPADRCDIDHSQAWPAPTTAANLGPLHRKAHNLKTDGLLSMRQPEPGVFEWVTRTGHTYTHRADPLPVTAWVQQTAFTPEFLEVLAAMPPPPDEADFAA